MDARINREIDEPSTNTKSLQRTSRLCSLKNLAVRSLGYVAWQNKYYFAMQGHCTKTPHDDENLAFVDVETGVHDADTLAGASKNFRFIDTLL